MAKQELVKTHLLYRDFFAHFSRLTRYIRIVHQFLYEEIAFCI